MNNQLLTHRRHLIPYLAKKIKAKYYLEIGVKGGKTFLPVHALNKIAVDPAFRIKPQYRIKQSLKYPPNFWAKYFECTSDIFFDLHANSTLTKELLDIAFIDGLHTAEQTYKDVVNTLPFLNKDGLIILHDCSPKSEAAAYPADSIEQVKKINPPGFDGRWSGDVWKVVPMLKINHPELFIFVIDHDSGIGIVSKKPLLPLSFYKSSESLPKQCNDIESADYSLLDMTRKSLLNILSDKDILKHCSLFR